MVTAVPVAISARSRRDRPASGESVAHPAEVTEPMPTEGPLVDRYGRVHDDLRISVTDRCNLRCTYCMPEEGMAFPPSVLSCPSTRSPGSPRVAKAVGISSIRLTGGEPLLRKSPS